MKGYCPECETLQELHPTDVALEYKTEEDFSRTPVGSARWNQVVLHVDKRADAVDGRWPFCKGSNKLI